LLNDVSEKEVGLSYVIKKSWAVYCQQIKSITVLMIMVYAPVGIIHYIAAQYILKNPYIGIPIAIMEMFFWIIGGVGSVFIVDNALRKDSVEMGVGAAVNKAFTRSGRYAITSLLAGLIIFGFCLLFVIPAIFPIINYIFIMQVVALRGLRTKSALKYSKSLVKGRWWKILWINFVIFLIFFITYLGFGFLSMLLPKIFGIIINLILNVFQSGFFTVAITVLFLKLEAINMIAEKEENEVESLSQEDSSNQ